MKNNKLKGRIVEKYGSIKRFAEAIGVKQSKLSKLLNWKMEWRVGLMDKSLELLDIPKEDYGYYFLPECLGVGNNSKNGS